MFERISIRWESTGEDTFANPPGGFLFRLRTLLKGCSLLTLSAEQAQRLAITAVEP